MNTKSYILNQFQTYPQLELQDLMKFLYQSSFGCEHLLSNPDTVKKQIQQELDTKLDTCNSIEYLDGDYVRLHLNYGLSVNTLSTLFILSSQQEKNGKEQLEEKLQILIDMISNKELPFPLNNAKLTLLKWKEDGYPAIHHSNTFNQLYHPSYRLIHKKYVPFLKLFKDIDNKHPSIISIDGRCASGKTTLSNLLKQIYDCNVFKMDDFFLQPHHLIPYKSFNVIEGSYSMHSDLQKYYSYSVFLTVSKEEQLSRLEKRNPNMLNNFIQRWIPLEELYFKTFSIQDICDIKIDTSKA